MSEGENKKYELLEREENGLCRIKALKNFVSYVYNVKVGDVGGYVKSEANLSQEGNCWIFKNAKVFDNAQVYGDAIVRGNAKIYGNARVYEKAGVCDPLC